MARYVRYKTEDGAELIFETPAEAPEAEERVAGEDQVVDAAEGFEKAFDRVKPMVERLVQQMRQLSPRDIEVQFGVSMTGSLGAVFASAEASGHFQITLKWEEIDGPQQ